MSVINKIKIFIKSNYPIIIILLLAFILRIWGVAYGLPGLFVGDEKSIVGGAMKMMYQKNIFPVLEPDIFRLLYYPTLIPWILLIFFVPWFIFVYFSGNFSSLSALRDYFVLNPESFFLIGRVVNVFFSVAVVYLIYAVTKKIFSHRAGLLAALIYAVSWLPIHQGHFVKHWNVGGFFALLALYFAINILRNPSWRNYILTGIFIGLAGCTDYVHVIYASFITFFHFLFLKLSFKEKILSRKFWLCTCLSVIIFIIGVATYPQEFYRIAFGEDSTTTAAKSLAGFLQVVKEIFFTLYYLETVLFALAIIGTLVLFFSNRKLFLSLLFIPILSPFLYYFLLHFETRYVLLFLPILAILAGFGLDYIIKILKVKPGILLVVFCFIIIFLPLKNAIIFDKMLTQTDTRLLAQKWIEDNLPFDSKIITNSWEFNLIRNSECIYDQQQTNNSSLRSRDYIMWDKNISTGYCVWPLDLILTLPKNLGEYQYYIIDSYTTRRSYYLGEDLMPRAELIKEFTGSSYSIIENMPNDFIHKLLIDKKVGPDVKIYKLNTIK